MEERSGFGYFLLGLGIGVAAGILWAPRSGEETRALLADKAGDGADYLRSRAQDGTEYVRQRTDDVKQSAAEMLEKGKHQVNRHRETLNAAVEAGDNDLPRRDGRRAHGSRFSWCGSSRRWGLARNSQSVFLLGFR